MTHQWDVLKDNTVLSLDVLLISLGFRSHYDCRNKGNNRKDMTERTNKEKKGKIHEKKRHM